MGTGPSTFAASGHSVRALAPVGVISDTGPANIPPFGLCQSLQNPAVQAASSAAGTLVPQSCFPVMEGEWSPGSSKVTASHVPALVDSSTCQCSWNGLITVNSPGQTSTQVQ